MPSPLKLLQTNTFISGLNSDVADELLQNDSYRYALNIHTLSTSGGQKGIVTNCKGTTEIAFDLPEGENTTIGCKEDTESMKFYFIVYNSESYHGIYMYNSLLNNVIPIIINLTDTGDVDIFEFSERGLILHIDIIRSKNGDDLMYFAQQDFKAKKFNVQKALDKSHTGYGAVILPEYINAYKLAVIFPPTLSYFTDTTRESNYLYTYLFKASVRHIYDDGERNNWSEFSTVPLPLNEAFNGNASVSNVNNGLYITVETGSSIVKQIELAIQINKEPFVSIIVLDKEKLGISDDTTYDFSFYNDNASYSGLDQLSVYRAYSFLPLKPALQSFTKNSIVYGKGLEGFETIDVDLATSVDYSELFLPDDTTNAMNEPDFIKVDEEHDYVRLNATFGLGNGYRRNVYVKLTIGADVKAGNKFELFGRNGENDNLYFYYTATNADDAISVANAIKQQIVATGRYLTNSEDLPTVDIWVNTVSGGGDVTFEFIFRGRFKEQFTNFTTRVNPVSFATLKNNGQSLSTHKSGGTVKYGVIYWDEDTRRSLTYTSNQAVVRTDFVTQTSGYKKVVHTVEVKNQPPSWAKYWELVRTQDLTYGSDFVHILIQKAIESQSTTTTDYVDLVIGSLYTYQEMYPNTVVRYEFEKNDRVRLIRKEDSGTYYSFVETIVIDFKSVGSSENITEDVTTNETSTVTIGGTTTEDNIGRYIVIDGIEREIIAAPTGTTYTLDRPFGTSEKYPSFQIVDKRGILRVRKPLNVTIEDNSLVEVYKPTQNVESAQKNFYLFGQKFAITDWGTDSRAHTGNIQNQDPLNPTTTPAIVEIVKGTTYIRNRQLPTNNQIPGTQVVIDLVESSGYSDFYESDLNDNGKIAPEDEGSGQRRFGSRLRFSSNYIEGTGINGLNDFNNLNREDYNDPYGDFMLLKFRESLLYAFKQLRTGYIPILANIIVDEAGQEILGTSSKLLNKMQYFAWEGGIGNNPESYASNQTWQYFLSPNSGVDCRLGGNGVLPISEQFFLDTDVQQYIKNAIKYNSFIHGGFDRENGGRILAFEAYNAYLYNEGFNTSEWQIYSEDYPEGTVFEITTQPSNGNVVVDANGFFVYTPNTDYVGSDPFYYRWMIPAGAWSSPKKECGEVVEVVVPPEPPIYYNVLLEETFTKNNCPAGYHGTDVVYSVPALTYSSPYSQEDADLQAQDDANMYGQINANNLGSCEMNVPSAFSFTDLTGLEPSTLTESGYVEITGSDDYYVISVVDGEYQIFGGDWTSATGVIANGAQVRLRRLSSSAYETMVDVDVSIGGVVDTWNLTTRAANNVTVNYLMSFGVDPTVSNWNVIERIRGGVTSTIATISSEVSGTLPSGDFKEGDTLIVYQGAYPAFMWSPDSKVTLRTIVDSVENYSGEVTSQAASQSSGSYVIANGVLEIDIDSIGSSTAIGYISETLQVDNFLLYEDVTIDVTDSSEAGLGLDGLNPLGATSFYSFNVLGTTGDLEAIIYNNKATSIDYVLTGEGGYLKTGSIAGLGSVTHSDVTKGGIVIQVSDTPDGVACGVPTTYPGGTSYPTIQVITLGSGTGTVTLDYDAYSLPDKFVVVYDGVEVINTGYRGNSGEQANLDAALATYGAPPEVIAGTGSGSANFVKSTATTTATVYVYAPMSGTAWEFNLSCPV